MKTLTTDERRQCVRQLLSGDAEPISSSNSGSKLLLFALAVGIVLVGSAGIAREAWNARALSAQVEAEKMARREAEELEERLNAVGGEFVLRLRENIRSREFVDAMQDIRILQQHALDPDMSRWVDESELVDARIGAMQSFIWAAYGAVLTKDEIAVVVERLESDFREKAIGSMDNE